MEEWRQTEASALAVSTQRTFNNHCTTGNPICRPIEKQGSSSEQPSPEKRSKGAPFLTKAFFNTVAPGLASFAHTQKSELDIVVEEDDEEEDPDVIAIMADF